MRMFLTMHDTKLQRSPEIAMMKTDFEISDMYLDICLSNEFQKFYREGQSHISISASDRISLGMRDSNSNKLYIALAVKNDSHLE